MDQHVNGSATEPEISADEIRDALRDYFTEHPGIDEIRDDENAVDGTGFDRHGWRTLAEQLGLIGIAAPEDWGGLGLGAEYIVAAVEECAVTLYPGPVRASVLTAAALAGISSDAVPVGWQKAITDLLSGTAVVGASTRHDGAGELHYRDGQVTGPVASVTHGAVADLVLCVAQAPEGPAVALVDTTSAQRSPVDTVDLATPLSEIVFTGASAVLLTEPGDERALERHRTLEALVLAAELVGGAQGCLARMVDYAKVREQFGALIGTYQAIQHKCSQTAIANASARGLVAAAAAAFDAGDDRVAEQFTLLARAEAGDAATSASSGFIQVSGGIGFTWEHDAHLYFRRARATAALGGTPAQLRDRAVTSGCLDLLVHGAA
ncbi:acyl-CoA dehydrogenase family protein [Gordonia rhizosphera NBRC 16068]|uniref:acyl-CoA dehydrogenase family protein n=1 Tax=Gordonia rhizosphera TaxID=83341 RepID=UPI003EE13B02